MSTGSRLSQLRGHSALDDINPPFGVNARRLQELGYQPIPLRAKEKIPSVTGWPNYLWQPDCFSIPTKGANNQWIFPDFATGLVTGTLVGVDVDVRDPKLCQKLNALMTKILGTGPDRVGNAPKFLRMFRTKEPFSKIRSANMALAGEDVTVAGYKYHALEVLGHGQQFVAYGIHNKTLRPYKWVHGIGPLTVPVSALTIVTREQCLHYLAESEKLLIKNGATVATRGSKRMLRGRVRSPQVPAISHGFPKALASELAADAALFAKNSRIGPKKLQARNQLACRRALAAVPNRDAHYDDWIRVGLAIAGALGESGRNDFHLFSAKSSKYDELATNTAYDGFMKYRNAGKLFIGAGTIFFLAREARSRRRSARVSAGVRR